ncbi:MAG: GNAT family N-acetyltransferase [Peptococcaceae bacterium]|nr:GNAT family N-acetyltransferase [Peptococcaceae bacterium]
MYICTAEKSDLKALLMLYTQLNENKMPDFDEKLCSLWDSILSDNNYYIIVGKIDNAIISSCTLIIVPNLTHNQRPYALVENVITDEQHRNKGYATEILNYAKQIAVDNHCYKIMLLTGSKKESTLNFYRKAGYNSEDKTGFIQWL